MFLHYAEFSPDYKLIGTYSDQIDEILDTQTGKITYRLVGMRIMDLQLVSLFIYFFIYLYVCLKNDYL